MWCTRESARIVLIVLNAVVLLAGFTLLISGILLKVESGFLSNDVVRLLDNIEYNSVRLGKVGQALYLMMIISGSLIGILGILGVCGGWHPQKPLLIIYIVIAILMAMIQITSIVLWISVWTRAGEWLKGSMVTLLKDNGYVGPTASDEVSIGWNQMFMSAHCCGVNDQYKTTNNDFSELSTTWYDNRGKDYIPATCCQGTSTGTVSTFVGSDYCGAANPPINFYTQGCYGDLRNEIRKYSLIVIIVCSIVLAAELVAVWSICVILNRPDGKIGPNGHQPPTYVGIDHVLKKKGHA